ncbi:MAG: hypothetical protein ACUVX9_18840 [Anaerolineae bacterium]
MITHRRLVLLGLVAVTVALLFAGSAVQPQVVRSDGGAGIETTCWCYWNSAKRVYCYRCCDIYGCYDLYCRANGC